MDLIGLPFQIKDNITCRRCTQRHLRKLTACPHCDALTDFEVTDLLKRKQIEADGHVWLGYLFGFVAIMLLVLLILITPYL